VEVGFFGEAAAMEQALVSSTPMMAAKIRTNWMRRLSLGRIEKPAFPWKIPAGDILARRALLPD
jgi:hypothetical protein